VVAPGTVSVTSTELYFEVDEDDTEYRRIDPEVGTHLLVLSVVVCLNGKLHASFTKRGRASCVLAAILIVTRTVNVCYFKHSEIQIPGAQIFLECCNLKEHWNLQNYHDEITTELPLKI
jgi:hypothetical protein